MYLTFDTKYYNMKTTISSIWVILILIITSCNTTKKATTNKSETNSAKEVTSKLPVISFEQTACFGTCPVHKMEVFADGSATYTANRNVKVKGKFSIQLSKDDMQSIFTKANELHFFDLNEEYTANMTDLPTSIIYINDGKNEQKVVAYAEYPENLKEFIQYLFKYTQNIEWEGEK